MKRFAFSFLFCSGLYFAIGLIFHTHPLVSHFVDSLIYGLFVSFFNLVFVFVKARLKLDAVPRHELPVGVTSDVWLMAHHGNKIAAIKLHREQNPDLSLADAKKDVETCVSVK
jgi:hypothetical protein